MQKKKNKQHADVMQKIIKGKTDDDEDDDDDHDDDSNDWVLDEDVGTQRNRTPSKQMEKTVESEQKTQSQKKKKKKNKIEDTINQSETQTPKQEQHERKPKKKMLASGTICEEMRIGHGPEARPGKMISVYYSGKLQNSGKQFDSCTSGKPFRFRLGKQEVIKGWDTGLIGMKVGGKRKLTIPPQQGYGSQRAGPIPPNSTLLFEVELKAVS